MRTTAGLFLIILTVATPCVCQSDSPPPQQHTSRSNLAAFSRFFSQVAALRSPTDPIVLNGHVTRLTYPSVQETIGLSDRETDLLKAAALRCEEELRRTERSGRAVTLSARLDSIDGQSESKQFAVLLLKRDEIVTSTVEALKAALGSRRFDVVHSFVLEHSTTASYFPVRAQ
jgi:hypothetical protein